MSVADVSQPVREKMKLDRLYLRPGFMIRRVNQIASEIFIQACKSIDMTPSQYSVLFVLHVEGALDQASIARLTSLDRSNTALVVKILAERRYIEKRRSRDDQRKWEIKVTLAGENILQQCDALAQDSVETLLVPFDETERQHFSALLKKFIRHFSS